jgi:anti-sigma regulatory factor (Ser/Thr protein kinase)
VDTPALQISLERNPQAPSLARAAITGFTEKSDISPESLATLTLLVSEVVSNAVVHSDAPASEIVLCAQQLDQGAIRVEVTDQGSGFTPAPRDPSQADAGYGLHLIELQATRWGVDQHGGTRVWFEIETRTPSRGQRDGTRSPDGSPAGLRDETRFR